MTRVATAPCTAGTARCADARDYRYELAECCRAHTRKCMEVTAAFLNSINATWWADYGTLLGAVRNPMTTWADYYWLPQDGRTTPGPAAGIVPHDKDGDLGILMTDWDVARRRFRAHLAQNGLHMHLNIGRHSMKARLSSKNHSNVDLFFWRERKPGGIMYRDRYASVDKGKGKEFNKSLLFPLTKVVWEGMALPAPRDPEAFLEMRYGPTWRTPIPANYDVNYKGVAAR